MSIARGQIVLLDFPFSGGSGSKVRPALVVQNDRDNARLRNTIVAMISSRVDRGRLPATQVLIELNTPEGQQTGLRVDSVVKCANLFTIEQSRILRVLGICGPNLSDRIAAALRAVFDLR
jgi:mRNA interferase MazF